MATTADHASARWARRAAREQARRRRMPVHGQAYTRLVSQMLTRRAGKEN